MEYFSSDFKLGILGGGQLGKMLLYNTRKYDIQTAVLDPSSDAPSRLACNEFHKGDLMDYETVFNFGKKVNVVTIEIENVNVAALKALEKIGIKVFPAANTLEIIQNKAEQKLFYNKHNLPTAPFKHFALKKGLVAAVEQKELALPFVWKSARFGYDGTGVKIVKSVQDLQKLPDVECIAEELVPFTKELAVIVARNPSGESKVYPVVEMEFHPEANQVEYVLCPARITDEIAAAAKSLAVKTSEAFAHVGLLAVEMFLTPDQNLLINEVAPRPHNSGHQTIEASYTSQFDQHLRAILDLPLGGTENKTAAVMVNLVGAEGHKGNVYYQNLNSVLEIEGATPHIYGKKKTRPFRKMGHVTVINGNLSTARALAQKVKENINVISVNYG